MLSSRHGRFECSSAPAAPAPPRLPPPIAPRRRYRRPMQARWPRPFLDPRAMGTTGRGGTHCGSTTFCRQVFLAPCCAWHWRGWPRSALSVAMDLGLVLTPELLVPRRKRRRRERICLRLHGLRLLRRWFGRSLGRFGFCGPFLLPLVLLEQSPSRDPAVGDQTIEQIHIPWRPLPSALA